jgi:aminoglycoside phosphotransferase (APT) family kinase protein
MGERWTTGQMHDNEVLTDAGQVRRLLAAQFPKWAGLPIRRVNIHGTDNAMYRRGDSMVVRMPKIDWAVASVEKEQRWLPRLASRLPVKVPLPLAVGEPGGGTRGGGPSLPGWRGPTRWWEGLPNLTGWRASWPGSSARCGR